MVVFSQHYAETRGYPTKKFWERVVEIYSLREAKGILGAIRIMMFGNAEGIAWGSFVKRFKKEERADERSGLLYEIGMILATIIYLPIALIQVLLAKLFRLPTIRFKDIEKIVNSYVPWRRGKRAPFVLVRNKIKIATIMAAIFIPLLSRSQGS